MTRIRGSHQIQWLDALHRHHSMVEEHVRTNKAMGLHNLPSKSCAVNRSWMLTANLAADLHAWLWLLTLHDQGELAETQPDTMRFRLYHLPAALASHARRRWSRIEATWPWAKAGKLRGPGVCQVDWRVCRARPVRRSRGVLSGAWPSLAGAEGRGVLARLGLTANGTPGRSSETDQDFLLRGSRCPISVPPQCPPVPSRLPQPCTHLGTWGS
ncbi:transposase [Streptomyces koyangensis]|uniref:transposase n=1 Tax=Streptomyces koyangensis TaxID=188770 RepID=UPI0036F53C2F